MKKSNFAILSLAFLSMSYALFGQDDNWEPQKQVTGYISTEVNFIKGLKYTARDYGASLSEAGLLLNYTPLKKLTLKSVFVYRPGFSIDYMINEVSGEYAFSDLFKIKGGRFLTPLSPVNSFYFAPVNVGITLPMLISHHEYYPLNLNGLSVNGNWGDQFKINYNVFAGGYYTSLWKGTGPLNFFGNEDDYFRKLDHLQLYSSMMQVENLNFGGGGHLGMAFSDYVEVGINYFTSKREYFVNLDTIPDVSNVSGATRNIKGFNFKLHYKFIQITGEQWWSEMKITNVPVGFNPATFQLIYGTGTSKLKGSYYELTCNFKTLTPFVRYEYHKANNLDFTDLIFHKYSFGLNYRPRYEINLKCEVVHYDHPKHKIDGVLASVIYSF